MAASLGARLLGCGARSSLPPPYKVCGAPRRRQRPTWAPGSGKLQALDFQAVSLESRAPPHPARSDGRSQARAAFNGFPFSGAAWAPFHLLGKQREVHSGTD